jgi:hypothetical protein
MEIAAFNQDGWDRVAPEKKQFWPTLHVGSNSPLLSPAARPYTTDNTRANALWAHYRDTRHRAGRAHRRRRPGARREQSRHHHA